MKSYKINLSLFVIIITFMITSCGTSEKPAADDKDKVAPVEEAAEVDPLSNKGVGPITSLVLPDEIDQAMVDHGLEVYEAKCTACHRIDKRFIGPSPKGIFERRSPEWVMNMILDPEKMVAEDPDAKALLIEYNGSPMANQNLTEEDARAVLEYFRTL
jgi:mono/diheme cytochrome c family protein